MNTNLSGTGLVRARLSSVAGQLPVASNLLSDWLKDDVIGFQTEADRQNFLAACKKILLVDDVEDSILNFMGPRIETIVNPVGIKPDRFAAMARREHQSRKASQFGQSLLGRQLILGAERLDYSKGPPERFAAYRKFLEEHPQFRHKVSYLQIAAESQQEVQEYRDLKAKLDRAVGTLNGAFADAGWVPLQYLTRTCPSSAKLGLCAA